MTGYLETLTDPSYYGQMVVQTFPLIGNYGMIASDFESKMPHMRAYIVRDWCQEPSNFRCEGDLDTFFKGAGDSRALRHRYTGLDPVVREHGVMNGRLIHGDVCPDAAMLEEIRSYRVTRAVEAVSGRGERPQGWRDPHALHVALWDFGAKANIQRELEKRGCEVAVFPFDAAAEEILRLRPHGVMLSNGPGDPAENTDVIEQLRLLCTESCPPSAFAWAISCWLFPRGRRRRK